MKKRVFAIILFAFALAMPMLSKTYLVSVGVADYPGDNMDLKKSANDARTMAKIYSSTKTAETVLMLDKNATIDDVMNKVKTVFAKAKVYDTVIFFFSGHGAPGALAFYDGLLQYDKLFDALKDCKASNKFIIADACYSGKIRKGKARTKKYNPQNIVFFLSSRTDEVSRETGFSNGLFTMYLERGLRGGADVNKDKTITAKEIYDFVHKGVVEIVDGKQHPVMWGNFNPNTPIIRW